MYPGNLDWDREKNKRGNAAQQTRKSIPADHSCRTHSRPRRFSLQSAGSQPLQGNINPRSTGT